MTKIDAENYVTVNLSPVTKHREEYEQKINAVNKNGIRIVYNRFYLRGNIIWGPTCGVKKLITL
jgi:hypothetical protein